MNQPTKPEGSHSHDPAEHQPPAGLRAWLGELLQPHAHSHANLDANMATDRGIWALKISLTGLLLTAIFQVGVVAISGSVALLADTLHNFSDALTAIPLWLAFSLARKARNRRYTYGYGRAEDLAGLLIVLMIFASAVLVFAESYQKIAREGSIENLGWVAAAALIGFAGNELVALFRIRVGRQIGSAALVADGLHARTDGLTSLGVLLGVAGVWLGYPLADPLVGFAIGLVILWVGWGAARQIWLRMMDAVDPALSELVYATARQVEGVLDVHDVTLRWLGHRQRSELHVSVDRHLPTYASHDIAEKVRHALLQALPALMDVVVHIDPGPVEPHQNPLPTERHPVERQN